MRITAVLVALVGCSGSPTGPQDLDGDGFTDDVDCNDQVTTVNPDAQEVCDGFDNDCDGDIDDADDSVDTSGFSTFFLDGDGDGYGTPDDTIAACSPPQGYVANDADCDDERVLVSPEQNEKCDGLDNDCDPFTEDSGVAFQLDTGEWQNLTNTFRSGTSTNVEGVVFQQPGTLYVCDGNYHVSLRFEADVEVRGLSGPERTVLDGGGSKPVVWIEQPVEVSLDGLTLKNGHDGVNTDGFGASLHCERRAIVSGSNLIVEGGPEQTYGGAISAIDGCELSLSGVEARFGRAAYGGLMYVAESTVDLEQVGFLEGVGTTRGGGLAVGTLHQAPSPADPGSVTCTGCSFQSNTSVGIEKGDGGGGVFLGPWGSLDVDQGLFNDNNAAGIGGAVLIDSGDSGGAELSITAVAFDQNRENVGKTANDISIPALKASYDYTKKGELDLTCDEVLGCVK